MREQHTHLLPSVADWPALWQTAGKPRKRAVMPDKPPADNASSTASSPRARRNREQREIPTASRPLKSIPDLRALAREFTHANLSNSRCTTETTTTTTIARRQQLGALCIYCHENDTRVSGQWRRRRRSARGGQETHATTQPSRRSMPC